MKLNYVVLPIILMLLPACKTPWYKLQEENDRLRAELESYQLSQETFESRALEAES